MPGRPCSVRSHRRPDYASKVLTERGVDIRLGTKVEEIAEDHVVLSGGDTIATRCVIWGEDRSRTARARRRAEAGRGGSTCGTT